MITYEIKIKRIEVEPLLNGLINVTTKIHYELFATNNENGMVQSRYIICTIPEMTDSDYISYDNLTEEIVLQWINTVTEINNEKDKLYQMVDPINYMKNQTSTTKIIYDILPWV